MIQFSPTNDTIPPIRGLIPSQIPDTILQHKRPIKGVALSVLLALHMTMPYGTTRPKSRADQLINIAELAECKPESKDITIENLITCGQLEDKNWFESQVMADLNQEMNLESLNQYLVVKSNQIIKKDFGSRDKIGRKLLANPIYKAMSDDQRAEVVKQRTEYQETLFNQLIHQYGAILTKSLKQNPDGKNGLIQNYFKEIANQKDNQVQLRQFITSNRLTTTDLSKLETPELTKIINQKYIEIVVTKKIATWRFAWEIAVNNDNYRDNNKVDINDLLGIMGLDPDTARQKVTATGKWGMTEAASEHKNCTPGTYATSRTGAGSCDFSVELTPLDKFTSAENLNPETNPEYRDRENNKSSWQYYCDRPELLNGEPEIYGTWKARYSESCKSISSSHTIKSTKMMAMAIGMHNLEQVFLNSLLAIDNSRDGGRAKAYTKANPYWTDQVAMSLLNNGAWQEYHKDQSTREQLGHRMSKPLYECFWGCKQLEYDPNIYDLISQNKLGLLAAKDINREIKALGLPESMIISQSFIGDIDYTLKPIYEPIVEYVIKPAIAAVQAGLMAIDEYVITPIVLPVFEVALMLAVPELMGLAVTELAIARGTRIAVTEAGASKAISRSTRAEATLAKGATTEAKALQVKAEPKVLGSIRTANGSYNVIQTGSKVNFVNTETGKELLAKGIDKLNKYLHTEERVWDMITKNNLEAKFGLKQPQKPVIVKKTEASGPCLAIFTPDRTDNPLFARLHRLLEEPAQAASNPCLDIEVGTTKQFQELPKDTKVNDVIVLEGKTFKVKSGNTIERIADDYTIPKKYYGSDVSEKMKVVEKSVDELGTYQKLSTDQTILTKDSKFTRTGKTNSGTAVFKDKDGNQYYLDKFHTGKKSQIEMFDKNGNHIGEMDAITGEPNFSKADKN